MNDLRHNWNNGERWLIVASTLAAVSFGAVLVGLLLLLIRIDPLGVQGNPFSFPSPQQILNIEEGPFTAGDQLVILGTKCNNTRDPIQTTGRSFWKNIKPGLPDTFLYNEGERVYAPGCDTRSFLNEIPVLYPGIWRLEGGSCDARGNCGSWYTDSFEYVIDKGGGDGE